MELPTSRRAPTNIAAEIYERANAKAVAQQVKIVAMASNDPLRPKEQLILTAMIQNADLIRLANFIDKDA